MANVLPAQNAIHTIPGSAPSILGEGITVTSRFGKERLQPTEPPVEAYQDDLKVPDEFVIRDPKKTPNRCWGDDDECKPNVEFPLIDLAPVMRFFAHKPEPGDEEAAKKIINDIGTACENWGFFKVVNHGIPVELIDEVIKVSKEFFQLPLEEKRKYAVRPGEIGGYGRVDFTLAIPGQHRTRFWNDVLRHEIRPVPSIEDRSIPLKPEAYRPSIEKYAEGLDRILLCVWKALSVYLGLAPDTLMKGQERDDDESRLVLRVNYYPKCNEPEKVLGVGGHKDFGSLTILLQDDVGGLQVQKRDSTGWLDVPPSTGANRGTLLVNIANQVEIMSNGRLHSVVHRGLVNRDRARLSIAAFANPGPKCLVAPLPEVLEKTGQLPRYLPSLYGDYIKNFAIDVTAGVTPHARYEINRK